MIVYVNKKNYKYLSKIMDFYFNQRHKVFVERLKWSVKSENFREIDEYDTNSTEYLIYIHPIYGVCGGVRLNPTMKPYMLSNTFSYLFEDNTLIPRKKEIWESSRFFLNMPPDNEQLIKHATKELFLAMLEFGLKKKLSFIITVTDLRIERILKHSGWFLNRLSMPLKCKDDPHLTSIAGQLEISEYWYNNIKKNIPYNPNVIFSVKKFT